MVKTRRVVLCITALLLFSLTAGCQKDLKSTAPSSTEMATPNPTSVLESIIPPTPTPSATPPEQIIPPTPERTTNPNLNIELIDFPDLDGFEKLVSDMEAMVVYRNGLVSMVTQYIEATQDQLDELVQGGGPVLEPIIDLLVGQRTVLSSKLIDLPGLDRKGLELELQVGDGNEYIGLIIPSEGQILALFGMATPLDKQLLLDGYSQLVQGLTIRPSQT